ncbi:hypothetical protein LCGC14_0368190 [marine sediment metagenome]|uniref:Uncharacterized protein n=1 Tax=marine sediment metagenome TaxID=412755 RepID=A0A0F9TNV1_9ZZZZ
MSIADFSDGTLTDLLYDLQTTYDISVLEEKYSVPIPQWITIVYRCRACFKQTRSKIQAKSIRQANRILICPFCRKDSGMFGIRTEKDTLTKKDFEF